LDWKKIEKLKQNMEPLMRSQGKIMDLICYTPTQTPSSRRQETATQRITEALSMGSSPESADTKVVMNALKTLQLEKDNEQRLTLNEQLQE
jgi:hypothetical protein